MNSQSDKDLIAAYLKGDEQSLAVLVSRYLDIVYKFSHVKTDFFPGFV